MRFVWVEAKDQANQRKHGISFAAASRVFGDPLHSTIFDRIEHGEVRFKTFGQVVGVKLIVVIHTDRSEDGVEVVRIISARPLTRPERRLYETENG